MPLLKGLNEDDQRALIHKIKSINRNKEDGFFYDPVDVRLAEDKFEKKLAKMSEEENFNLKNTYRHKNLTMNYANKKRMALDET